MHPSRAIWAIGCGQLVNWGVLFFAFSVLLVPLQDAFDAPRWLVAGAFSLGLLVSAIAAPAVGRLVDRGQGPAVMRAGGLLAAGAPDPLGAGADDLDDLRRLGRARPVHGLDPLRTGLRHGRSRVFGSGRPPARDRDGDRDGRTREHRISSRHVGARHAIRLAGRRRRAGDHHRRDDAHRQPVRVSRPGVVGANHPRRHHRIAPIPPTATSRCTASIGWCCSSRSRSSSTPPSRRTSSRRSSIEA